MSRSRLSLAGMRTRYFTPRSSSAFKDWITSGVSRPRVRSGTALAGDVSGTCRLRCQRSLESSAANHGRGVGATSRSQSHLPSGLYHRRKRGQTLGRRYFGILLRETGLAVLLSQRESALLGET